MTIQICEVAPDAGYWERDNSHFPLPMSRYLWELFMPAFDEGTRRGFARYGSLIDHFDVARIRGRFYQRVCPLTEPEALAERYRAAEKAISTKLWRTDGGAWPAVRDRFRNRLLKLGRKDLSGMNPVALRDHLACLQDVFRQGVVQHFVQQPASMFPVGDWVRRTCEATGSDPSEVIALLQGSSPQSADFLQAIDEVARSVRDNPAAVALLRESSVDPQIRMDRLRQFSVHTARALDDYLDEYADRILTGFDIMDSSLLELPHFTLALIALRLNAPVGITPQTNRFHATETQLRQRMPPGMAWDFDEGLAEAREAYGLHDEDVRITYLWPLGLIRRALREVSRQLARLGALRKVDDVFHTTPEELDSLLLGGMTPSAHEIGCRAEEWVLWSREESCAAFGWPEPASSHRGLPETCARMNAAIHFYFAQMEGRRRQSLQQSWATFIEGLPASSGCYEGWARVIQSPADFGKLHQGDVLIARTTSAAYNMMLPMIGAVVTDRGGVLCHAAIVAREFGIPAVVGTNQATLRIPDGARVFVDGDRGFVAVRGE